MKKKIFIVILNWNRAEDTLECLESVKKLKYDEHYEVTTLVVDNGSEKDCVNRLKSYLKKQKGVHLLENSRNLGFVEGNNVGLRYALKKEADYLMILNNDTIVDPDLLMALISAIEKDSRIGALSPKIYFASGFEYHKERYKQADLGKVIWYAGGDIDWDNVYGSTHGVDQVDEGEFNETVETDFATGTCLFLRREALEQVGLLDSQYYLYFEDTDLSVRLKRADWKVVYEPSGIVWHKVSQSSGIGSELNDYFLTRNRLIFGMRYASLRTKLALIRESIRFLVTGRKWQKRGVRDFYIHKFGRGSWS